MTEWGPRSRLRAYVDFCSRVDAQSVFEHYRCLRWFLFVYAALRRSYACSVLVAYQGVCLLRLAILTATLSIVTSLPAYFRTLESHFSAPMVAVVLTRRAQIGLMQ